MKILFEFSRSGLPDYLKSFEIIRKTLIEGKNKLTHDLLLDTKRKGSTSLSIKISKKINDSISSADCVIIEGSIVSLAVSYVLAQSINLNKPVLFLIHSQSPDINRSRFAKTINSKLLTVVQYDNYPQIPEIINKFFDKNKYIKTRFNLVLPADINGFITSQSKNKNISKTEYIINLIHKEIESTLD